MDSGAVKLAHTYVIPPQKGKSYKVVGWSAIVFGFVAMGFFWAIILRDGHGGNPAGGLAFLTLLFCMPIVEGFLLIRGATRVAVKLTSETIQIRGLLRYRELALSEIVGSCKRAGRGGMITYLVSATASHRSRARLPDDVAYDETFNRWLASVPDLDAIAKEKRRTAAKLHWWED